MVPVGQVLVATTGLPCTGKSALAEAVARAISAPVFSVDPLEATLNRAGITREHRSGYAAYDLVATLAESQLVLDAVEPLTNNAARVPRYLGAATRV